MKRLFSILIIVSLIIGCLTSCSIFEKFKKPTVDELIAQADDAIENSSYRISVDMTFTSDKTDEITKQFIKSMNAIELTVSINGEKAEVLYGMELEYDGVEIAVDMKMTVVDDMLYIVTDQTVDGEKETTKIKAAVTEEQSEEMLEQTGSGATEITSSDFENVEMEKVDGVYVITCDGLKEESKEKLNGVIDSSVGEDSTVTVSNAKVEFEIKDGKYQKATVTCDYVVDIGDGETMELGATFVMNYTYEEFEISAPLDYRDYREIDL